MNGYDEITHGNRRSMASLHGGDEVSVCDNDANTGVTFMVSQREELI